MISWKYHLCVIYTRILTNSNLWPWPLALKIEMVLHYILVSSVWSLRKLRHKITCTKTAAVLVPQGGTKSFEEDFGYLVSVRFCSCIKTWSGSFNQIHLVLVENRNIMNPVWFLETLSISWGEIKMKYWSWPIGIHFDRWFMTIILVEYLVYSIFVFSPVNFSHRLKKYNMQFGHIVKCQI